MEREIGVGDASHNCGRIVAANFGPWMLVPESETIIL
jgi:hypothetical protein